MRILKFALPIAAFVLGVLVAHAVRSTEPSAQTDRDPASAANVGVVVPFDFEGEASTAAEAWVEEDQTRREQASDSGIALETYEFYAASAGDGSAAAPDAGAAVTEGPDTPLPESPAPGDFPLTPSDGAGGAIEPVIDLCAGDPTPDYCPDGVGGTVLFTLETPPPFDGMISLSPHYPGTAPYPYYPECEPMDLPAGAVQIGVTVNRPADIELALYSVDSGAWRGRTVGVSTEAQDAAWLEWLESEESTPSDPEQWMTECVLVDSLDPGVYEVEATFSDAADSANSFVYPRDVPLELRVGDPSTQSRRPTLVVPMNVDRVLINATLPSDQWLATRALELTAARGPGGGAACLPEYASISGAVAAGAIDGAPLSETVIPAEVREADDYPYLPEHDVAQTHEIFLTEGADYLLCLYWMDDRGSGADSRPVATEAIPVSTPEAYHPSIRIESVHNPWGALGRDITGAHASLPPIGYASNPACAEGISASFGAGDTTVWMPGDRVLCDDVTGVDHMVRHGLPLHMELEGAHGETYVARSLLRIDPRCSDAGCVDRDPHMMMIPLPDVPTERAMCGSGFGAQCDADVPMRSAGALSAVVTYIHTDGNGATSFRKGQPRYGDTGPRTPAEPYVDVDTAVVERPWQGQVRDGMEVAVTIGLYAGSTRTVYAHLMSADPGEPLCTVSDSPLQRPVTLSPLGARGEVIFRGLCAGAAYRVVVTDPSDVIIPVWPDTGWDAKRWHNFTLDPLAVPVRGRILAAANEEYSPGAQTAYSSLAVGPPGAYDNRLDANVDDDLVERLASGGWHYDDRRYSACGAPDRVTRYQREFRDTVSLSHGQPVEIEAFARFRPNSFPDDGADYTCTPMPYWYLQGSPTDVEAAANVSIDDLLDGVALEYGPDDDGNFLRAEARLG